MKPIPPRTLTRLIAMLRYAIEREAKYPRRPELARRVAALGAAARPLLHELADPQIGALLGGLELDGEAAETLRRIEAAAAALDRLNPRRQGRGRLYPDPAFGPDARELCATIVRVLWWRQASGQWPGVANPAALLVCEALWLAAGGEGHGGIAARNGSLAAWRRHLRAARRWEPPQHPAGVIIANIISAEATQPPPGANRGEIRRRWVGNIRLVERGGQKKAE